MSHLSFTKQQFLAPLAVGQRAMSWPIARRASVRALTFSLNIFFSETTDFDEISQKCSCHGPLKNFLKEFDSFKNSGCHGNKTYFFFKTFLSETIRPRATNFRVPKL